MQYSKLGMVYWVLWMISFPVLWGQGPNETEPVAERKKPMDGFFGVDIKYYPYQSFSRTNPDFPYRGGYPIFLADMISLDLRLELQGDRTAHFFRLGWAPSSNVTSDNGFGNNFLLNASKSTFYRLQLEYFFQIPFISLSGFDAYYGFSSMLLYEKRNLTFVSGSRQNQWDFGPGIGPHLSFDLVLSPFATLKTGGHFLVFLPYVSMGRHESVNRDGVVSTTKYFPFTLSTLLNATLQFQTQETFRLEMGYRLTDQVGFGNPTPSFSPDEMVTYKLERFHEFFIGLTFKIFEQ